MPAVTSKLKMLELLERTFPLDQPFTLQQVYPVVQEDLQRQYPNNNTIQQTIRGNLMKLRDDGIIRFDEDHPGTYYWATGESTDDDAVVGTVYVIKNLVGGGGYKIGVSRVIKNRLKQLEVGTKAEVVGLWESPNYTDLERMLHQRYKSERIPQSEWFCLGRYQLDEIIEWLNENASQVECHVKPRATVPLTTVVLSAVIIAAISIGWGFLYLDNRINELQLTIPRAAPILLDSI